MAILDSLIAFTSSGPIGLPRSIPSSMKVLIPLLPSSLRRWLRKVLRTSPPQKLGKTSCVQVREEEEEEEAMN